MARPPAKELTEGELEVMHVFWSLGEATATEVRDELAGGGLDRLYDGRHAGADPARKRLSLSTAGRAAVSLSARAPTKRSRGGCWEIWSRPVFAGSREQLLVRLLDEKKLTAKERAALEAILKEG